MAVHVKKKDIKKTKTKTKTKLRKSHEYSAQLVVAVHLKEKLRKYQALHCTETRERVARASTWY